MMTHDEMQAMLEHNAKKQNKVYVPNEIFEDLVSCDLFQVDKHHGKANHIAFAFSYYYLISYLYRECKFFWKVPIGVKEIKRILGYNENYKNINYLIKNGGLLDEMGYTESTYDFPVSWGYEDGIYFVKFLTAFEEPEYFGDMRLLIKKPIKAFFRDEESKAENYYSGTYYEVMDTTMIPFDVFMFCMTKQDLGVKGFFLYSFIRYKSDYYGGSFDMTFPTLAENVGFSESTVMSDILCKIESAI